MVLVGKSYNFDRTITDLAGEAIDIAVDSGIQSFSSTEKSVTSKWRAIVQASLDSTYPGYVQYGAVDRYRLGIWQVANRDFVLRSGYLEYLDQLIGDYYFVLPKPNGAVSAVVGRGDLSLSFAMVPYYNEFTDTYLSSADNADALYITPAPGVTLDVRISGVFDVNELIQDDTSYYYLP